MRYHQAKRWTTAAMLLCSAWLSVVLVGQSVSERPKIMGIAHVALASHDLEKSRAFYSDFLGMEEVSKWKNPDGTTAFTFFKVNDRQFVELTPEQSAGTDRLGDVSFETDDVRAMRLYLAGRGVPVPSELKAGRIGNLALKVTDPAGHTIEFVQYLPTGQTVADIGKHLGPERISTHLRHAGLIVTNLDPEYRFYTEVLGFKETWRGSSKGNVLSWINLKAPDSDDYVELMLYKEAPGPAQRLVEHHLCLLTPNVEQTVAVLRQSAYLPQYGRDIPTRVGINRKRQATIYDPDGTRIEIMEPGTIDGTVTPSSMAPPPQ